MKTDINQCYRLLSDSRSSQFCGSACILSCYSIMDALKQETVDFKEAFPETEDILFRLFEEDSMLFALLYRTDELSDQEWKKITEVFVDYQSLFEDLNNMLSLCSASGKERYLPVLKLNYDFLANIAKMNLESFSGRGDKPSSFDRTVNDVLVAMRSREL